MIEEIKAFVKANYPPTAFYAIVRFNSEYNDETYNNRPQSLMVFDNKKEEILPKKACTQKIIDLLSEIPSDSTYEEREDLTIIL
jgi:hypothetical protein